MKLFLTLLLAATAAASERSVQYVRVDQAVEARQLTYTDECFVCMQPARVAIIINATQFSVCPNHTYTKVERVKRIYVDQKEWGLGNGDVKR